MRRVMLVCFALLCASAALAATGTDDEVRLRARLAPEVAARVLEIVAHARAQGLPTDPIVGRALEGASRHVRDELVVAEVARQAESLASARAALGDSSGSAELTAGASALLAGVPADSLTRLRSVRPRGSLVVPIVVLCDFVARGVPVEAASGAVLQAARAGTADGALLKLRTQVSARVQSGADPAGAVRDGLFRLLREAPEHGAGAAAPRRGIR